MDLDVIRAARSRQPFEPFALKLADGRLVPVAEPEYIAIGKQQVFVFAANDALSVIDVPSITSVESCGP